MLRPIRLTHNSELVETGSNCPFCMLPFHPDDLVIQCPSCKTPYHAECWRQNGNHCSILGCSGEGEVILDALSPIDSIRIWDSEIPSSHEQSPILASDLTVTTALEPLRSEQLALELSKVNTLGQRTKTLEIAILLTTGVAFVCIVVGIFLQIRIKPISIEPSSLTWIGVYLALGFLGGAVLGAIIGHTNTDTSRTH